MNMIQNDNQNVDGVDQHPKLDSHYYLFIGDIIFITLHNFNAVLWLMIVEVSVVSVSSSLVFCGNSVQ